MKYTADTSRSFRTAILAVLTSGDRWPQPVIYAYDIDGVMMFAACNHPAMPSDALPWMFVEGDSFCDLTGDHEADSHGIECNMFEDAVNDTLTEIRFSEMFSNDYFSRLTTSN